MTTSYQITKSCYLLSVVIPPTVVMIMLVLFAAVRNNNNNIVKWKELEREEAIFSYQVVSDPTYFFNVFTSIALPLPLLSK